MDASSASIQPQQPSSAQPSTTGPQIRSRITVVCAECKRLKLKCDRRAPCGSCTKRGTVERCVYSPAAAEKVDLHSLNNRLIQVEATLALVTSGQNTPAFQSTYPLAQLSNAGFSSQNQGSHQHHHHYTAPTLHNTCISLSHQDLSLWLEELDLGISLPSSSSSSSSSHQHNVLPAGASGYIKLEPPPFEIELTHPRSSTLVNSTANDMDDLQMLTGNTSNSLLTSRTSTPLKRYAHLRTPSHQQFQSQSQAELQQQQRYSAQLSLPALSIYYRLPSVNPRSSVSSAAAFQHHPPPSTSTIRVSTSPPTPPPSASASSFPYTFPAPPQSPQYSRPQITPALIALLPSLPTCRRFLNYAKEVFRVRPVAFEPGNGWIGFEKRCISLLGGDNLGKKEKRDEAKEREKGKAREAKRARQIYFAGLPELQSLHQRNDNSDHDGSGGVGGDSSFGGGRIVAEGGGMGGEEEEEEELSIAFFAVMCAVLAVGSQISSSSQGFIPAENPAFLFALSQQALGVWDTHTSTSGNAEEKEQMDFLLASLIGVVYLMLSGSLASAVEEDEDIEGTNLVYPLVGKMVNAARGMGLDSPGRMSKTSQGDKKASCDASASANSSYLTSKGKERESERWEDWKLLMWWDIMFYDLFIADSLGRQPYAPSYTYTTKLPGCASDPAPSSVAADTDNGGFDTEDEELEHSHGFDSGQGMTPQQDDFDGRHRYWSTMNSSMNGGGVTEPDQEAYFGARCRLTQLTQTIKRRMAHPECCCGYTLDQAASLESEIRRWQSDLAPSMKRSGVSSSEDAACHSHPPPPPYGSDVGGQEDKPAASLVSQIQSCELALMANLLIFRVHAPFLRAPSLGPPTSLSQPTKAGSSTSQLNGHAVQLTVHAAQSILRTARTLHVALGSLASPMSSIPFSMLDFYPLEKMVLDSIIICANPGLSTKSFTASMCMFDANALMDDVISGLNLLSELRVMAEPHRKIVDALCTRLSHRGTNLLKRKYDQVGMSSESLASSTMTTNASVVGGCVGDGIMSGFDGGQYVRNGNSVTRQQPSKLDPSSPFSPPVSSILTSSGGPQDHKQRHAQKHKKSDNGSLISAITTAASARLAAAAERHSEKGKDKSGKHAKKTYPSVGIRVRVGKDGSVIRPQRVQATAGSEGQMQAPPLMTTTPRTNADTVLAFQQQQKQKLQAATATPQVAHAITGSQHSQTSSQTSSPGNMNMMHEHEHRSRSSSCSRVQPQQHLQPLDVNSQSMDLPLPFVSSPEQMDIQAMPRKDYGIHDTNSQRQHSRHKPFGSSAHMFEQTQSQPQPLYDQSQASFDHTNSSSASGDGMSYNQVSSPFSNGSGAISASSSPFTTNSGHPSTPTFPSHHSTPPIFGPTSAASPATYFHSFNTSYATNPSTQSSSLDTLQQHGNGSDMPLMDMGMDPIMMPPVLETSTYDKSQQQEHAMYDPKSSIMDNMSRHHQQQQHQQHFQRPSYDDGSQNRVTVAPPWPSPPQQQQSSISAQNSQSFWNNGEGFKFYS